MSLLSCFTDGDGDGGEVDVEKYLQRRKRLMCHFDDHDGLDPDSDEDLAPPSKKRRLSFPILARQTEDGDLEVISPTDSIWYLLYVSCPNVDCKRFQRKFRRRFRMPYESFRTFCLDARAACWFPRWMGCDATGKKSSPLELLILGSLRYLGRGWTFDDCEESTAISEEVHRTFFHQFILIGSTVLFDRYVLTPRTKEDVEKHMEEFKLAGLPGACGSSDATCIMHEMCSHRLQRIHKGHKSKSATRTYNLTADHRRQILATTSGHPGSFNDKTTVLHDEFITDIKSGAILDDYTFELLERREGKVFKVKYRGVWLVVDNGYHSWSITVPPFTNTNRYDEIRWSEWLESMRKDVECTFGILKGRWRILKTGIRLYKVASVDMIWKTCCAFHNMLLKVDGLDRPWDGEQISMSSYSGRFGDLEFDDMPAALQRLLSPSEVRAYDTTATATALVNAQRPRLVIQREDANQEVLTGDDYSEEEENACRVVRDLSLTFFSWTNGRAF